MRPVRYPTWREVPAVEQVHVRALRDASDGRLKAVVAIGPDELPLAEVRIEHLDRGDER